MEKDPKKRKRIIILSTICLLLVAIITFCVPLIVLTIMEQSGEINETPYIITMLVTICIDIAIVEIFNWRIKSV